MKLEVDLSQVSSQEDRGQVARVTRELLLCCARTQPSESNRARIRELLAQPPDWDELLSLARRHSVLPLLFCNLNASAATIVPSQILAPLRQQYQDNAARNLFLTAELCRLLVALGDAGVEAIPYKGPALAAGVYGDAALRRYIDLDLMVRKRDVLRARAVLIELGYKCNRVWSGAGEKFLLRSQHNMPLSREGGRLLVELHWEVAPDLFAKSLGADMFWDRLEPLILNGMKVRSLAAEDLLLALCVHGSKHLWERLAWICDVAELVNARGSLDWELVLRRARDVDQERMLGLGLNLASRLLEAQVPAEVRRVMINDRVIEKLGVEIERRLFTRDEYRPATAIQVLRFNLRARRNWRSRMRYCRLVFKPTDADLGTVSLPHSLRFFYYLLRPFRLVLTERERSA